MSLKVRGMAYLRVFMSDDSVAAKNFRLSSIVLNIARPRFTVAVARGVLSRNASTTQTLCRSSSTCNALSIDCEGAQGDVSGFVIAIMFVDLKVVYFSYKNKCS